MSRYPYGETDPHPNTVFPDDDLAHLNETTLWLVSEGMKPSELYPMYPKLLRVITKLRDERDTLREQLAIANEEHEEWHGETYD